MAAFNSGSTANYPSLLNQLGSKNIIVNGDFRINQESYVSNAVLASGAYGHDQWKGGASGGDYTFTQLESSTVITIKANKTLIQVIEAANVVGGTYVLSWTGTALARYAVNSATPAGAYAASPIVISGQTAGTTMSVEFGNGASTGTLSEVQLEVGTVAASNFERRLISLEWTICQRYYHRIQGAADVAHFGDGSFYTTTLFLMSYKFPVRMRAAPTLLVSDAADFTVEVAGASRASSAIGLTRPNVANTRIDVTVAADTAGRGGLIGVNANKWIAFSARI